MRTTRVVAGLALAGTLAGCVHPGPTRADAGHTRPNIVLLMADDLGWGDVGFHGHPRIETPHLDAMAADGLRFERFYAAAPVCSPTRGSCLTGRHPLRYGIRGANSGHLPADERTLTAILRDAGYTTGHFGKWHLGTLTRRTEDSNRGGPRGVAHYAPPWERDFDVVFSTEAKVPTHHPMLVPDTIQPYGTAYWVGEETRERENLHGDDSRVIMDRVVPFVREAAADERPFFAVVWFHTPHLPLRASEEDRAPFADLAPDTQHYYGAVRAMDREIGRLRATISDLGIERDTMVWFASDNGPEGRAGRAPGSTGGLRGRKRDLYEGGVRVPGLLVWPARVEPGSVTAVPTVTSDYLPTICDWLGLEVPARALDGRSLAPWVAGSAAERGTAIGFETRNRVAWIGDREKLVGRKDEEGCVVSWELYDLAADAEEAHDLAEARPARLRELGAACEAWRVARERDDATGLP